MRWQAFRQVVVAFALFLPFAAGERSVWSQSGPAGPESTYVKLLKKAPEARLGTIIEVVGKRGNADDLAYLLDRATLPTGPTAFAAPARRQARTCARKLATSAKTGTVELVTRAFPDGTRWRRTRRRHRPARCGDQRAGA